MIAPLRVAYPSLSERLVGIRFLKPCWFVDEVEITCSSGNREQRAFTRAMAMLQELEFEPVIYDETSGGGAFVGPSPPAPRTSLDFHTSQLYIERQLAQVACDLVASAAKDDETSGADRHGPGDGHGVETVTEDSSEDVPDSPPSSHSGSHISGDVVTSPSGSFSTPVKSALKRERRAKKQTRAGANSPPAKAVSFRTASASVVAAATRES